LHAFLSANKLGIAFHWLLYKPQLQTPTHRLISQTALLENPEPYIVKEISAQ